MRNFQSLVLIALGASALIAPAASAKLVPLPSLDGSRSLDALREGIYKSKRSKPIHKLAIAVKFFESGKFAEARRLAGELQSDPLWCDYGYWLASQAFIEDSRRLLRLKKYAPARELAFKSIAILPLIQTCQPDSPWIRKISESLGQAELVIADSHIAQKKFANALPFYEKAWQRLTTAGALSGVRPNSLDGYARGCKKTKGSACTAWLWKLGGVYPENSQELKTLTKAAPEISDRAKATHVSSRITQSYRTGSDPDFDAFDEAFKLALEGKTKAAKKSFEVFLDEYPRSVLKNRVRYWLSTLMVKEGDNEKAKKLQDQILREAPLSYYGLLAAIAQGKPASVYLKSEWPSAVASDPFLTPAEIFKLHRGPLLLAEGLRDFAAVELRDFRPRTVHTNPFLLYLAMLDHEAGNHPAAFVVLTELIQRGYDGIYTQAAVKMIFPIAQQKVIEKFSAKAKVDPILVMSLMKQESAFDSQAASNAGAHGLMQLMPATASDTDSEIQRADLTNPEVSIRIGVDYLKSLLDRYDGNIAFALAAYNAGPGAVNRWIRAGFAKQGIFEFIEQIPFRETRDYVGSILRNYFWYSSKIKGESPKSVEVFWNGPAKANLNAAPGDDKAKPEDEEDDE